jgi:hypothetical protein
VRAEVLLAAIAQPHSQYLRNLLALPGSKRSSAASSNAAAPRVHLRAEVDLAFRIQGQSVEIFEIRPDWMDGTQKIEERVAKATYQESKRVWKVYWQRADLEWHVYQPMPEVTALEQFVAIVDADQYGCFFG